jgi:hypothetical protein
LSVKQALSVRRSGISARIYPDGRTNPGIVAASGEAVAPPEFIHIDAQDGQDKILFRAVQGSLRELTTSVSMSFCRYPVILSIHVKFPALGLFSSPREHIRIPSVSVLSVNSVVRQFFPSAGNQGTKGEDSHIDV